MVKTIQNFTTEFTTNINIFINNNLEFYPKWETEFHEQNLQIISGKFMWSVFICKIPTVNNKNWFCIKNIYRIKNINLLEWQLFKHWLTCWKIFYFWFSLIFFFFCSINKKINQNLADFLSFLMKLKWSTCVDITNLFVNDWRWSDGRVGFMNWWICKKSARNNAFV